MKTLVVVEDDELTAKLFEFILTKVGNYRVVTSECVTEILELVHDENVVGVIMDIYLTNSRYEDRLVDGLEITRLIRTLVPQRNLPIILASAHVSSCNAHNLVESSGADDYITKPISSHNALLEIVAKWVESRGE